MNFRQLTPAGALVLSACVACLVPATAGAVDATTPTTVSPPAVQPAAPPAPAPGEAPAAGSMKVLIGQAHGNPAFAVVGERIAIAGGVRPYVAGQKVLVSVYRNGHKALSKRLSIGLAANGTGQFRLSYSSPQAGMVSVKAEHLATPELGALTATPATVRYLRADLGLGAGGHGVRLLQDELARMHYEVPVSGRYDEATERAVIAFRKVTSLVRVGTTDARIFRLLQEGAGRYHVRYSGDGNHVEGDLTKQVLVEVERGGRVRRIYTMSSGKPSTPTVLGRFRVYSKTPGTNSEGMVDSNYFIRGYAIHGYAEVPVYAASHGCLRIPIPNAPAVFSWVQLGYPVDVFYEDGRGSHVVRDDAGP